MRTAVLLGLAIVSEVVGSLSLRAALDGSIFYAPAVLGYLAALLLLAKVLRRGASLGVVYGVWCAAGISVTTVCSVVIYSEPMTGAKVAGLALMCGGVLVMEVGSSATPRPDIGRATGWRS
ncbi:DMT family transporter [Kribbella sp. NPDC051620]|uniref:DMT family transporter n=1 Tax=Kribbella sp. NPDC051620 TaxID=3364120 RepID=UPI00378D55DC